MFYLFITEMLTSISQFRHQPYLKNHILQTTSQAKVEINMCMYVQNEQAALFTIALSLPLLLKVNRSHSLSWFGPQL